MRSPSLESFKSTWAPSCTTYSRWACSGREVGQDCFQKCWICFGGMGHENTAEHFWAHVTLSQLHGPELHCTEEESTLPWWKMGAMSSLETDKWEVWAGDTTAKELWLVEEAMVEDPVLISCSKESGCNGAQGLMIRRGMQRYLCLK